MKIPFKENKNGQINVRVDPSEVLVRETLKARGVNVGELYRQAIKQAHMQALREIETPTHAG